MKKLNFLSIITCFLFILVACQNETDESFDVLDPGKPEDSYDHEQKAQLGYVRYTKDDLALEGEQEEIIINREQTADMITRLALQTDNFQEVATLVTDQEVIIAYEQNEESSEQEAAEVATKTAQSILPSFYKIHTTSHPYHMDVIHSLHLEQTNNTQDLQVIERLLEEIDEDNRHSDWR